MDAIEPHPLSLSEILTHGFSCYRKHFWTFVGIMAIPEAFTIPLNLSLQGLLPRQIQANQVSISGFEQLLPRLAVVFAIMGVAHFMAYAVALGATAFAVSQTRVRGAATVRSAYAGVTRQLVRLLDLGLCIVLRYLGALLLVAVISLVGGLTLGFALDAAGIFPGVTHSLGLVIAVLVSVLGVVLGAAVIFTHALSIPALILERLNARAALKRGLGLARGYWGRILVIGLLTSLVAFSVTSMFQAPFILVAFFVTRSAPTMALWSTLATLVAAVLGQAFSVPWMMTSLTVLYYDLRLRKEGHSLQSDDAPRDLPAGTSSSAVNPQT